MISCSGVYTCVAWNTEGADTKSVSVFVDSQGSVGWWSDGGNQRDVEPSRERPWLGNSSSAAASLVVVAKVPASFSVKLIILSNMSKIQILSHLISFKLEIFCYLCRWFTLSPWFWSGSCIPAGDLRLRVRTSRMLLCLCLGGPAPQSTLTTLRSATLPR